MSFEEWDSVDVDEEEDEFTIRRKDGRTFTYDIEEERDLFNNIMNSNDVDVFEIVRTPMGEWESGGAFRWF